MHWCRTRAQLALAVAASLALTCARTDSAEKRPTRPTSQRTLVLVVGAPATDPALAVPIPATDSLRKHVQTRLTGNKSLVLVPDDEITAVRLRTPTCKSVRLEPACETEIQKGTAPDLIVRVTVARQSATTCSLTVETEARRADLPRPFEPASADAPCEQRALQAAVDGILAQKASGNATAPGICENRCEGGEQSCQERSRLSCVDGDWDGCKELVPEPCGDGQGCSRGKCVDQPAETAFVPEGPYRMGSAQPELALAMSQCRARQYDCLTSWWKTEQPAHWVSLSGFFIDLTEVTNEQYAACVAAGACRAVDKKSCRSYEPASNEWLKGAAIDKTFSEPGRPVVCVSHEEARSYCGFAKKRLPTEAEWEKAARGADGRIYPWGNQPADGTRTNGCDKRCGAIAGKGWRAEANLDDQHAFVAKVGSFPAGKSPYGVLDMSGNVWEWVADRYSEEYYSASERQDPKGPSSGNERVVRGGSWSNEPDSLRAAYRYSMSADTRLVTVGFRCAGP
jgi:formylglycine-generating enzyme required for sulfatase activity